MQVNKKMNSRVTKPLVSVIIPVFNGASYLVEAVDSVQKSDYTNFEILLINDGSSDNSKIICKILEKKYENLRFYDFPKNKGLGKVLNFALTKAYGVYICRLNQDDRMFSTRMKKQVIFLDKNPDVVAVGSHIKHFYNNGNTEILKYPETDEKIKKLWNIVGPFSDPSVMYRKQIAIDVGGYDESFWPADDTQLWYRMGMKGKLANIQEPLVEVRWHEKAGSVYYFREMAWQIYRARRWSHKNIEPCSLWLQIFWIVQLIASMTCTPKMNWKMYRTLKYAISFFSTRA